MLPALLYSTLLYSALYLANPSRSSFIDLSSHYLFVPLNPSCYQHIFPFDPSLVFFTRLILFHCFPSLPPYIPSSSHLPPSSTLFLFYSSIILPPYELPSILYLSVAEYFGEAIAFYFAYTAFYTRCLVWPAILGIIVFGFQVL